MYSNIMQTLAIARFINDRGSNIIVNVVRMPNLLPVCIFRDRLHGNSCSDVRVFTFKFD